MKFRFLTKTKIKTLHMVDTSCTDNDLTYNICQTYSMSIDQGECKRLTYNVILSHTPYVYSLMKTTIIPLRSGIKIFF